MSKKDKNSLGYLGQQFQLKFLGQLLTDSKFANSIMEIVKPEYFDDEKLRCIIMYLKNNFEQYETVPDYVGTEIILRKELSGHNLDYCLALLTKSKDFGFNNALYIQDTGKAFFKQQETIKVAKKILEIAEDGDIDRYHECEELLKKALEFGAEKDDDSNVFDKIDEVLEDDYRDTIPCGIEGIDIKFNGGVGRGEVVLVIAPTGTGKTTMFTKVANTGKNQGKNVLQIFFEDNVKDVQRKHFACWTGIELNELSKNKETVKRIVLERYSEPGILKLKKYPSTGVTINKIKQYIKKQISNGFRPDLILIDYIDCILPSRNYSDNNLAEGATMRELETMVAELNIACWVASQGNRDSIGKDIVQLYQMGGSIKKTQIAHAVISIAKTLTNTEEKTATISILKSRFGDSGIVFKNCIFDNSKVQIETLDNDGGASFKEIIKQKSENDDARAAEALKANRLKKEFERAAKNLDKENINVDIIDENNEPLADYCEN